MENFLKQFSTIPHEFITDFFIIAKEEYYDNEIIIDFDTVSKWLKVNKSDIKKNLIKHFEENFDYTIEKINKKHNTGANIYYKILITPNCLKELCMISQTAKAKEVRKYFIEMEKLIKRYFETIKEEVYKKVGILEKNQKPKVNIDSGIIYILKALNSDTTLYKLGKTTNLKNRLKTYNSGNANDIEPLFILPVKDIDSVESCIKKGCKKFQYRKYKEVYEIDIEVLKEVMEECNEFVNHLALKLTDKTEGKIIKDKIIQMKKKQNKYFIYISKNNK
jgi:phage anti-repressor protein